MSTQRPDHAHRLPDHTHRRQPHHSPASRTVRRAARGRGSAPVEVLTVAFGVMAVCLIALQIFAVMYAGQAAGRAAWDGARALSLGQSASSAAHASVPSGVQVESVQTLGDGVRVTVRPHAFLPFMDPGTISRSAYLP